MKDLIVLKYGGTSVSDEIKITKIAQYIKTLYKKEKKILIVISAMGKFTDELIEIAYNISSNPRKRELDIILTTGERISMALLSIALNDLGIPAISFTGSQSGIITDCSHTNAKIMDIKPYRVKEELEKNKVVIVAGFQGVSTQKNITTLGRGGSDLTAVSLAAKLNAEECFINTDVEGIYPVDPKIVKNVSPYKKLSLENSLLFASAGAKVMYNRACSIAAKYNLKYTVRSSAMNSGGTKIMKETEIMECPEIIGITSQTDIVMLKVSKISKIKPFLEKKEINIKFIIKESDNYKLFIENKDFEFIKDNLTNINFNNCYTISIVGHGFSNYPEIYNSFFEILENNNINCDSIISESQIITLIFKQDYNHEKVISSLYEGLKQYIR